MGIRAALLNRRRLQNTFILLAIAIALIPAGWSFQGQWLTNLLPLYLPQFYLISGLCVLAVMFLVWLARPSVPDWIQRPPNSVSDEQKEGMSGEGVISRSAANWYIGFSACGFMISLVVAVVTRHSPGVELLVFTLLYWFGWYLREGLLEKVQADWIQHRRWLPAFGLITLAVILGFFCYGGGRD